MGQPMSDTGAGLLVGAEPAQPRTTADWGNQPRPDQAVTQQQIRLQEKPDDRPAYRWTDQDIEAARQQEKDKLYGRIEDMGGQLKALQEERAAERAERERLADEADAARRAQEEGEMNVRDLLAKKEQEWQSQFDTLNKRYDTDRA